jgi:hypothetical protein
MFLQPQDDTGELWEIESSCSDSSDDMLGDGEEELVVPASFALSTSIPSPLEDDPPAKEDEDDPPQALDNREPSFFNSVYGSDSKYSNSWKVSAASLTLTFQGLNHDHPLSDFGFAVNVEVDAIICVLCRRGIPLDMVRSHCRKYHPGREAPSLLQQKEAVDAQPNSGFRLSGTKKYSQAAGQKPVDGLEVLQGYACPAPMGDDTTCSEAFLAKSSFVRHLSSHLIYPKPDPSSCASKIQTLFGQGGLQAYFPVDISLSHPDPPPNSAYADALELLLTLPKPQIPTPNTDKERESVHWFTRWPELLQPYCNEEAQADALRRLVSFPQVGIDPEWLTRVQDHGKKWWTKAETAHVKCSPRASVLLKSHQKYVLGLLPRSGSADLLL